jgi:putative flippase GtrA
MTFLKYLVIQVLAYVIDMGSFLLVLQLGIAGPIVANIFSKLAAGSFAFVAHRSFTFSVAGSGFVAKQAVRYFLVLAVNVPVASAILGLILIWLPHPVVAKFLSDIVSVGLSYALSKHFVFNVQTSSPDSTAPGAKT